MRIPVIYTYSNSYYKSVPPKSNINRENPPVSASVKDVQFTGSWMNNSLIQLFRNPLTNFKNYTAGEYMKLSAKDCSRLRDEYDFCNLNLYYDGIGEIHNLAADCLKTVFDKRFGKNNYVVLPIGRSVSTIGKVLGLKIGEENVKNIPLSSAGRFYSRNLELDTYKLFLKRVETEAGFEKFLKYLSANNLSRSDIENSGKNYILTDYCFTGESLLGVDQLFKSDLIWGNKKKNIYSVDILKAIDSIENSEKYIDDELLESVGTFSNLCEEELLQSKYKCFSLVGRAESFDETLNAEPNNVISKFQGNEKLMMFHLLDTALSNTKPPKLKFKNKLYDENMFSPIAPNQNVELWHDVNSQYQSDLRNDIIEINKLFINLDSKNLSKISDNMKVQSLYNDIRGIYKYLNGCNNNRANIMYRFGFYEIRQDIYNIMNSLNEIIYK